MGTVPDQRTSDELAGIVDLFGGLTRAELERALSEVAFRADGQSVDEDAAAGAIEASLDAFALVRYEPRGNGHATDGGDESGDGDNDGDALFVPGPTAFPRTPEHAEDLPHILDVSPRDPDQDAVGEAARDRFLADVEAVLEGEGGRGDGPEYVNEGDDETENVDEGNDETENVDETAIEDLIDLSYDLEAWAPLNLVAERTRLVEALEDA
ncbi:DUF7109 family protein [Natronosalvus halobius]|uniref:DUF7109 family protein n=1 Tax=Natronosalvus halobius TaxID=2953746 RepID=UPI00209D5684|nr:hypothetical protein [Natronosalvus halobius]USZ72855.1 hypothetical protein NGM15_06005 [Natronosalvus halobius]